MIYMCNYAKIPYSLNGNLVYIYLVIYRAALAAFSNEFIIREHFSEEVWKVTKNCQFKTIQLTDEIYKENSIY